MTGKITEGVFSKILRSVQSRRGGYVRVSSAHLSGISYLNIGDAGLEFLEDLSKSGIRFRVKTTINPGCVDFDLKGECDLEIVKKQERIVQSLKSMGAITSLTCTPYLFDNPVKKNQKIAWAESSAVLYTNSILGASTNKEGSLTALASAILGYTAKLGVHARNGKKPEVLFEYQGELNNELEYGLLGYVMGLEAGAKIPYLSLKNNLGKNLSYFKQLLASFGTSGAAPIVWIENITPGSSRVKKPRKKIVVTRAKLDEQRKLLSENTPLIQGEKAFFIIGCPHLSLEELEKMNESLKDIKKLLIETWAFTSYRVYSKAFEKGMLKNMHEKGVRIFKDSCIMHCKLKGERAYILTNSVKAAYYLRGSLGLKTVLKSLGEVIEEYGSR